MHHSSLHSIVIAFALIKLFVKASAFTALFIIIERTANIDVPILFTLPPVLRAVLIAAITWTLLLPLYFDVSSFIKTIIHVDNDTVLLKQGFFVKNETSWKLKDIQDVVITQTNIGEKYDFGDVTIVTKRQPLTIKNIKEPQLLKSKIC